jgi:hypothetical protein
MQALEQTRSMLSEVSSIETYFRIAMNDPKQDIDSQNTACEMTMWAVSAREILDGLMVDLPRAQNDIPLLETLTTALPTIREQIDEVTAMLHSMDIHPETFAEVH